METRRRNSYKYYFHKLKINEMIVMKYECLTLNSWNDDNDIYTDNGNT